MSTGWQEGSVKRDDCAAELRTNTKESLPEDEDDDDDDGICLETAHQDDSMISAYGDSKGALTSVGASSHGTDIMRKRSANPITPATIWKVT